MMLTFDETRKIVTYCAEEVRRQRDTYAHVAHMVNAWLNAIEHNTHGDPLSLGMIETWGKLVDPDDNPEGFRSGDVWIAGRMGVSINVLEATLDRYMEMLPDMTPIEAYKEFEFVHPFFDGNGRTGKIILNYLSGTLYDPIFPPNDLFGYWIDNP